MCNGSGDAITAASTEPVHVNKMNDWHSSSEDDKRCNRDAKIKRKIAEAQTPVTAAQRRRRTVTFILT